MKEGKTITLAIESSCDETSVAIVADGREVLSNVIASQIDVHKAFGGVVPEIASRHHLENINAVTKQAIEEADITLEEVDMIGVANGPGLVGALLIGVATAKAFAFALNKPLVAVHHIHGHISANFIENKELEPPFVALVVSGGHTNIVKVKDYTDFEIIGQTRDDAIGEAYDKVARVLGLGYPGGPLIDNIAKEGNCEAVPFKRVYLEGDTYDFSFSGTKTGVLNYINKEKQKGNEICNADVAASFQQAVLEVVVNKAMRALKELGEDKIVLAGGVAANSKLREMLQRECELQGIKMYCPSKILCTDNAAMIGAAAYYKYLKEGVSDLHLDAYANINI